MACLLRTIKADVASTAEPHSALPPERLAAYGAEYDALICGRTCCHPPSAKSQPRLIGRPKQAPPKNLLDRLHKHKAGVLDFMYDFRIPFDNTRSNAMCV